MKTKLLIWFIVMISLISFVSAQIVFQDTFTQADGSSPSTNWDYTGTNTINNGFLTQTSGGTETYLKLQLHDLNITYLRFDFKSSDITQSDGLPMINFYNSSNLYYSSPFYVMQGAVQAFNRSGYKRIANLTTGAWYTVEITNITLQNFNISVNGTNYGQFTHEKNVTSLLSYFEFKNRNAGVGTYYSLDNITACSGGIGTYISSCSTNILLNISAPSIPNNTQYNTSNFNFNINVNASKSFNCSFYFQGNLTEQKNYSAPLIHYTFDDGVWLNDTSGNGNNGFGNASNTSGIIGSGALFNGDGRVVKSNGTGSTLNFTSWTISLWVKANFSISPSSDKRLLSFEGTGYASTYAYQSSTISNRIVWGWVNSNNSGTSKNFDIIDITQWNMITFIYNGTTLTTYQNGDFVSKTDITATFNKNLPFYLNNSHPITLGKSISTSTNWTGSIDDFRLYDRALSDVEIAEIYNQGLGDQNNFPRDLPVNFTKTLLTSGQYNYSINCKTNDTDANTTTNTFYFDSVIPTITSTFTTNTIMLWNNNLSINYTFTDDFSIYSYNITIDGNTITNLSNIIQPLYILNLSYNTSSLTVGQHLINAKVADGHTADMIPEYNIKETLFGTKNSLTYAMPDNVEITSQLKDSSMFDIWTTEKEVDKYTQTIVPNTPSDTITIIEEANEYIDIVNDPTGKYKQQYIIFGNHWKDYVLPDEPDSVVSIKRLSDTSVEVTISGITNNPEELTFASIGDLNIVNVNYTFYIVNITNTYSLSGVESELVTATSQIDKVSGINTNVLMYTNETLITTSDSKFGSYDSYISNYNLPQFTSNVINNYSLRIEYFIEGFINNLSGNFSYNTTVYNINLTTCGSLTNTTAFNFTIRDEKTNSLIFASNGIEATFYKSITLSTPKTNNFNYSYANNFYFCLYPNVTTFYTDFTIVYSAPGYNTRFLYLFGQNTSNVKQDYTLYLTNSSLTTEITITVSDDLDTPLEGYYVDIYSYDIGTGIIKLIDTEKTNTEGKVKVNLDVSTNLYRFDVRNSDGDVVLTRPKEKLISTEYLLQIKTGTIINDWILQLLNQDITITGNKLTHTFVLDYTNLLSQSYNLTFLIFFQNYSTQVDTYSLANYTYTSNNQVATYVIPPAWIKNGTYFAQAWVYAKYDGNYYLITSDQFQIVNEQTLFEEDSTFAAVIFIITLTLFGFWFGVAEGFIMYGISNISMTLFGLLPLPTTFIMSIFAIMALILLRLFKR